MGWLGARVWTVPMRGFRTLVPKKEKTFISSFSPRRNWLQRQRIHGAAEGNAKRMESKAAANANGENKGLRMRGWKKIIDVCTPSSIANGFQQTQLCNHFKRCMLLSGVCTRLRIFWSRLHPISSLGRDEFGEGVPRRKPGPARPRPSSRQILGSWVVFPEPVSPQITTTWWSTRPLTVAREPPTHPFHGPGV